MWKRQWKNWVGRLAYASHKIYSDFQTLVIFLPVFNDHSPWAHPYDELHTQQKNRVCKETDIDPPNRAGLHFAFTTKNQKKQ